MSLDDPSQPLLPYSALSEILGMGRSDSGIMVSEMGALKSGPIFAGAKIISEDLSKIPLNVRRHLPPEGSEISREHYVHPIIHDDANERSTACVLRASWIASAILFGHGYVFIRRDNRARACGLYNLPSDKTNPAIIKGVYCFVTTYTEDGLPRLIAPDNILHLPGLSLDGGVTAFSPVTTCKNVTGIALAAEKYAATFFANGARSSGVLMHPETLEVEARENLQRSIQQWATGESAFRPILLEEGLQWQQISVKNDEGQMNETRKFQVEEVGRLLRIPAHKLGLMERSSHSNIEQQAIEHKSDALQPWAVKIEQEINRKLLSGNYYCEHDFEELERGDSASIATSVMTVRNAGLTRTNEGRARLRLNPLSEEEGGNVITVQGANIPLSALVNFDPQAPPQPIDAGKPPKSPTAPKSLLPAAYRRIFRDALGRIGKRQQDQEFAHQRLHVVVASMAEAVMISKYGSPVFSATDDATVIRIAASLDISSPDLSASAEKLANETYEALMREL